MQTLNNHSDTPSYHESFFSRQNMPQLPSGDCRLYSSLNCNRIALKCLKIRGNHFSESLMMMAADSLLQWFDQQLVKPIQIVEADTLREVIVFGCIRYQRDAQAQSFTSHLSVGKSQPRWIPGRVALNQLLPDQWIEAVLTQAIAVEYLNEIKSNRAVYRRLQEVAIELVERDTRFQHLNASLLPCALALDEQLLSIAHHLFPHGNASFVDLTLIWRNARVYQKMIDEENQLLRLFHLTRLQRLRNNGRNRNTRHLKQTRDLALVAVF
jgi:hypothetical protein